MEVITGIKLKEDAELLIIEAPTEEYKNRKILIIGIGGTASVFGYHMDAEKAGVHVVIAGNVEQTERDLFSGTCIIADHNQSVFEYVINNMAISMQVLADELKYCTSTKKQQYYIANQLRQYKQPVKRTQFVRRGSRQSYREHY